MPLVPLLLLEQPSPVPGPVSPAQRAAPDPFPVVLLTGWVAAAAAGLYLTAIFLAL